MSKASEWAKALDTFRQQYDAFAAKKPPPFRMLFGPNRFIDFGVNDDGGPRVFVSGPAGDVEPDLDEVLKLGRWILDTFGEAP